MRTVTVDDPLALEVPSLGPSGAAGLDGVWAPSRRRLTLGLVLTITLVAFEALAISTVMPIVADDLGGLGLYGWVFSGFFLGNLLGIVTAGQSADELSARDHPESTLLLRTGTALLQYFTGSDDIFF